MTYCIAVSIRRAFWNHPHMSHSLIRANMTYITSLTLSLLHCTYCIFLMQILLLLYQIAQKLTNAERRRVLVTVRHSILSASESMCLYLFSSLFRCTAVI